METSYVPSPMGPAFPTSVQVARLGDGLPGLLAPHVPLHPCPDQPMGGDSPCLTRMDPRGLQLESGLGPRSGSAVPAEPAAIWKAGVVDLK